MSAVFLKVLELSLMGSILICVILLLRLLLRHWNAPAWIICGLWALAALRLICPFTLESSLSLMPKRIADGQVLEQWTDDYVGDILINWPETEEFDAAVKSGITVQDGGYVVTAPDGISPANTVETAWIPVLSLIWLCGIAGLLLYSFISWVRLKKQVAAALEVDGIMVCDHLQSPFILGVFRPRIYLPSDLDGDAKEAVLAHERAHLARHDHWWKPLAFGVLALHWFNPLVWVAYVLLCRDMELACDQKVIRDYTTTQRKAYSTALLELSLPRRQVAACPLAFGEVGVKERVGKVLHYKKPVFWVVLMALLLAILAGVCLLTAPREDAILQVNGYHYIQSGRPQAEMTDGSRQIGRLKQITTDQPAEDWTACHLKQSYEGVPIYQADPRQLTVYLATSDGFLPFEIQDLPQIDGDVSVPYEWHWINSRLTLPEYPGIVLEQNLHHISTVNKNGHTILIGGDMLRGVWLLDLNGDGKREICAELEWEDEYQNYGTCIQVCDLSSQDGFYQLSAPTVYDYHLVIRYGKLAVNQTGY